MWDRRLLDLKSGEEDSLLSKRGSALMILVLSIRSSSSRTRLA